MERNAPMQNLDEKLGAGVTCRPLPTRANRGRIFACERLESRDLLSLVPTLTSSVGTISKPFGSATVDLTISDRFTVPASGHILFDFEVVPVQGTVFSPGLIQVSGASVRHPATIRFRSGDSVITRVALEPGVYAVKVHGIGRSTGSFVVLAHFVGDVNGDGRVNQTDIGLIDAALGTRGGRPGFNSALDVNGDGRETRVDLVQAKHNVGASSQHNVNFQVADSTSGAYPPNQVYFAILGKDSSGQFCHVDASGNLIPMSVSDNDAANHLTKNGQNYSNYFFTLSDLAQGINVPNIDSGRVYFGLGSPLYIKVNTDINGKIGYAGPDLNNPQDPNLNVYFDTIEFTIDGSGLHGNTTQVDQFGFPMTMQLQSTDGTTAKVGITEARDAILSAYKSTSNLADFQGLLSQQPYRILAPKHSTYSQSKNPTYFDSYIADTWTYYTSHDLVLNSIFGTFTGRVINNVFTFTRQSDPAQYLVQRPQTWEVFAAAGVLASGNAIELNLEAQIDAAITRHVALDPQSFNDAGKYYQAAPANFYAAFWHQHSIDGKAYGFDYDDVNNQSSSISSANPKQVLVSVSWN
jgi:hypothetical protein